jgi:transposase
MKLKHHIALDLHHTQTVVEAQTSSGAVTLHRDVPTEPVYLIDPIKSLRGPKGVVIEEGPMADWAMRVIRPYVDEVIICDPHRNRLICGDDQDKNDHIDPGNLITLYRTGQLRAVHHPRHQSMMDLRRWVWLYHDQVELAAAAMKKIKAFYREVGIQYGEEDVYGREARLKWLDKLPGRRLVRDRMGFMYANLDYLVSSRDTIRKRLYRLVHRHPVARRFLAIPGYGEIRSITFLVIVDTPYRFCSPQKLWRYGGLGLYEKQSSHPENKKLRRPKHYNRRLKAVAKGAMEMALIKPAGNAFLEVYRSLLDKGLKEPLARLVVARKMLSVPWGMWKSNSEYNPRLVGEY